MGSYKYYLVVVMVVCAVFVKGQTKREMLYSLDTLMNSHTVLLRDYNALKAEWKKYNTFFYHVKAAALDKKVINASPAEAKELFDSVWSARESRIASYKDSTSTLLDSLKTLNIYCNDLIKQKDTYLRLLSGQLSEAAYPYTAQELLGEWRLFLSPKELVDGDNTALISHNPFTVIDSLQQYNLYRIDFLPDELATLFFKGGRKQKCFYKISDFSANHPYSVAFSKQDEFKLKIYISPMPHGLEVSYKIPVDSTSVMYFNGAMKP